MISIKDGKLYQWDTGRIVMCKAPEGMWIDEIHLDNYTTKNAIILNTYLDGDYVCAKIPDVVLQKLNPINIYTVMKVEDNEKTIESMQFNIIQRKKPEDYVYEEEEILRYDKLEEKLEELEERIDNFEPGGGGGGGNVEITAESIEEALGYVPADKDEIEIPDYSAVEGEKGHILNRPFYEDVTIGELLPATTVVIEGLENLVPHTLSLTIGNTYTVNWNGTDYAAVCKEYEGNPALGNIEFISAEGNSGEPFVIMPVPPELVEVLGISGTMIVAVDDSTEVVVSVSGEAKELKKLDNKFLSLDWLPVYDGEVEVFPETSLESGSNIHEIDFTTFNEGEKAIVYCDGVRYECICKSNNGYIMFGNVNIYNGADTGEPFVVSSTYSKSVIMFIDGEEHTVSINKFNYRNIPKWYLPKDVFEYVKELKFIDPFTDANVSVRADQKGLYVLASDGTVLTFLPNSSSFYGNYEGKVLKVVDGTPAWSDIPEGGSAEVTKESIKEALGYVPADEEAVNNALGTYINDVARLVGGDA